MGTGIGWIPWIIFAFDYYRVFTLFGMTVTEPKRKRRYLLSQNPSNPQKVQLAVGATVVPVEVIPNADLPTESQKIPFFIGDLYEAVKYWDRQQRSIKQSDVAQVGDLNAFEQDLTIFRAIEREDVTFKDQAAFVYGVITAAAK